MTNATNFAVQSYTCFKLGLGTRRDKSKLPREYGNYTPSQTKAGSTHGHDTEIIVPLKKALSL